MTIHGGDEESRLMWPTQGINIFIYYFSLSITFYHITDYSYENFVILDFFKIK